MAAPLPVPDTRALNMQRRRERILQAARGLIGSLGFSGLTLRELAEAAGVTVPTIYNLIGNKDQLLRELNEEMMSHLESRLASRPSEPALARAEAIVTESIALFSTDADFYRAALIAADYVERAMTREESLGRRSVRLPAEVCRAAQAAGELRGTISAEVLGEQIFRAYRTACRDWANHRLSLSRFRAKALLGVYLTLAADAVDTFHCVLVAKIGQLHQEEREGIAHAAAEVAAS
jgi:AcrR family transcriptional regulator